MPDRKHLPVYLILALVVSGIMIPAAVSAGGIMGPLISSSTSVSGQAVVNDTVTFKKVTYTGDSPDRQMWKFQNTFTADQGKTWKSSLFFDTRDNLTTMRYSRMGGISPFSINI